MQPLILQITGMSCGHCLNAVSTALSRLPGVTLRTVRMGRAELNYDPAATTPELIATAVADAGYPATPGLA